MHVCVFIIYLFNNYYQTYYQLNFLFILLELLHPRMSKSALSQVLELKLKQRIVQRLQKNKGFGYKVINNSELQVINKYYSSIYGQNFNFRQQHMHLFGSFQTMYAYLMLGLTNVGDVVVLPDSINSNICECIEGLNRKILKSKISELSKILENKNIKITLLVLSNPDMTTGLVLGKQTVKNILQMCNKNGITVICDESMSTICPHQNFYSLMSEKYNKLVLIKQIDTLFNKYIAFFGGTGIKEQIQKSGAKSLKILPSDLVLTLIHTSMSEDGLKYRSELIKNMRANYDQLRKVMIHLKYEQKLSEKCQSQYLMINTKRVKSQISGYILKFLPSEQLTINEQRLIRIDLNCLVGQFIAGLKKVMQSIPESKL